MLELVLDHEGSLRGTGKYSEVFKEYVMCVRNHVETRCLAVDEQGRQWRTDRLDAQVLAYTATRLDLEVSMVDRDGLLMQELNPRNDGEGFGTWASLHRRYDFNESEMRENWFKGWDEMYKYIMTPEDQEFSEDLGEGMGALAALPVYMFDYSILSFSTNPFSCQWDSGQIGFIYATKKDIEGLDLDENDVPAIEDRLREAIALYDQWRRGEVWEYVIFDYMVSPLVNRETLDVVSGFFSEDNCRKQGEESLRQLRDDLYKRVRDQIPILQSKVST